MQEQNLSGMSQQPQAASVIQARLDERSRPQKKGIISMMSTLECIWYRIHNNCNQVDFCTLLHLSLPMTHQVVFLGIACRRSGLPHAGPQRVHCSVHICTVAHCKKV